jgi:predicted protein tyrosine phosphatase
VAMRVLFICSRNRWRSPTAEAVFAEWPGVETASAGLAPDAETPVTPELLAWAELICVMEANHQRRLTRDFGPALRGKRVVCLRIADKYRLMDPQLVALLRQRVPPYLA